MRRSDNTGARVDLHNYGPFVIDGVALEGAGRTDLGAVQAEGPVVTVGSCEEGQGEARSVKGAQHNVEFNMR